MNKVKSFLIVYFFLPFLLSAQNPVHLLKISAIPQAYKGDLNSSYNKLNAGLSLTYIFNRKDNFNGSLNLGFGQVEGQDPNYQPPVIGGVIPTPNTFFKTNYVSFNYDMRYHIIKKNNYWIYVSAGVGLIRFNPKDENGNSLSDLPETRFLDESFNKVTFILPVQLGVLYFLPNYYGIGLEFGLLNTMTDYLDNISDWGVKDGFDNILQLKISFIAPLRFNDSSTEEN